MSYGSRRLEHITEQELQGVGAQKRPVSFAGGPVYHLDGSAYFVDEDTRRCWYEYALEKPIAPRYVND